MSELYRKSALESLSTTEQLDKMIVVTPPSFYLVVVGAAIMTAVALVWACVGQLPVNLDVSGIYVRATYADETMDEEDLEKIEEITGEEHDILICYAPLRSAHKVHEGMEVMVYPSTVNRQEYGHMEATVVSVDSYVTSQEDMEGTLGDAQMVDMFTSNGPVVEIICELRTDESTASGLYWSSTRGAAVELEDFILVDADIVLERKTPITLILPYLSDLLS